MQLFFRHGFFKMPPSSRASRRYRPRRKSSGTKHSRRKRVSPRRSRRSKGRTYGSVVPGHPVEQSSTDTVRTGTPVRTGVLYMFSTRYVATDPPWTAGLNHVNHGTADELYTQMLTQLSNASQLMTPEFYDEIVERVDADHGRVNATHFMTVARNRWRKLRMKDLHVCIECLYSFTDDTTHFQGKANEGFRKILHESEVCKYDRGTLTIETKFLRRLVAAAANHYTLNPETFSGSQPELVILHSVLKFLRPVNLSAVSA